MGNQGLACVQIRLHLESWNGLRTHPEIPMWFYICTKKILHEIHKCEEKVNFYIECSYHLATKYLTALSPVEFVCSAFFS